MIQSEGQYWRTNMKVSEFNWSP